MTKERMTLQAVSRRDALRVCLLPAGIVGARWLAGCSSDTPSVAPEAGSTGTAQAGTQATSTAGTSAAAGSKATTSMTAGTSASAAAGGGGSATHAASSGSGATAGAVSPAIGGAPAAGAPAAAGSGSGGVLAVGGSSASAGAGGGSVIAMPGTMWATGGTKSLMGGYPDPFAGGNLGSMCVLYPTQTIGPCYAMSPMMREDISDGLGGLPMRLSFLVVQSNGCKPIPNASIDIWHSGSQGIYSAYATGTTCNPGMDDVKSKMFCRGVQITNESGEASFNTVFPGWYRGRTIHIHFTVRLNNKEAVTSQIYFDDALVDEILAQGDYKARGKRDTNNKSDMLFTSGGAKADQVLFTTAKRPDGVLHAWKVLQISG
jgi:protocatechuate 3,4-dioxygenase beta subunit